MQSPSLRGGWAPAAAQLLWAADSFSLLGALLLPAPAMNFFRGWGLLGALLTLSCCSGESVPACAPTRKGESASYSGREGS